MPKRDGIDQGEAPAPDRCPGCGSSHRIRDAALQETHCADCGLVFDRAFSADDVRFGGPTRTDGGRGVGPFAPAGSPRRPLGSTLGSLRDARGNPLDSSQRNHYFHLRWLMNREVTRHSQGVLERSPAREHIARAGNDLGLPPVVVAEAERLFREGTLRGTFRGRGLGASVGASLYGACRRFGLPRTLGEISSVVNTRRSEVGRAFKALCRGLGSPLPSVALRSYLQRYAQDLALSPRVRATVEDMLQCVEGNPELSGLSPHGVVAALIYLASERSGEPRTRTQVARVGAVTEVTLRSTTRILSRIFPDGPPG